MDYFTPLSFCATFGRVSHIFLERWKAFLTISALVYMAGLLCAILTAELMGNDLKIDGFSVQPRFIINFESNQSQAKRFNSLEGWSLVAYCVEVFIYYCFSCIAHGATVWLAIHLYLDQQPSILEALSNAGTKVMALTCCFILNAFFTLGPIIIIILPILQGNLFVMAILAQIYATFLQIIFYHAYPAIMVENAGPLKALARSCNLTSGHRCFILGVLFVWLLVRFLIGFLIGLIASYDFNEDYMPYDVSVSYGWQYYVAQVLDKGIGILFLSLESVFQAVLYLRSRVANESLDRFGLASALGSTVDGDDITMTNTPPSVDEQVTDKVANHNEAATMA